MSGEIVNASLVMKSITQWENCHTVKSLIQNVETTLYTLFILSMCFHCPC